MSSFLQTKEWMEFQESLGREILEYNQDGISAKIIKHDLPFKKSYFYIPHGPEMDFNSMLGGVKNPVRIFINWLKDIAKNEGSIFLKIEPMNDHVAQTFAERGFRRSKKEIQPSKTVIIDLGKDENVLLGEMHHKTRYNIKIADRYDLRVSDNGKVEEFWNLLKKTIRRDNFSSHSKEYYQKLSTFFQDKSIALKIIEIKLGEKPLAGAMILLHDKVGYYLHGCSDTNGQKYRAPFKLHWSIIKYLKNRGFNNYDLWGINAQKWPGVTRFKLGWGGRVIERPGSFDLPVSKLWYTGYKIFRKII